MADDQGQAQGQQASTDGAGKDQGSQQGTPQGDPNAQDKAAAEAKAKAEADAKAKAEADAKAKAEADAKAAQEAANKPPATPDGYKVNIPEGLEANEAFTKGMTEAAHKAGLTQAQLQQVADAYHAHQIKIAADFAASQEASIADLQKTWGDNYEPNLAAAKKAMDVFADKDFREVLEKAIPGTKVRYGDHPAVIKHFFTLGRAISEGAVVKGEFLPGKTIKRTPGGQPILDYTTKPGAAAA